MHRRGSVSCGFYHTNVDFGNSNGGAPKELPLYKKPKLTVVATCREARKTIFAAFTDKNVAELYDLKVISSENEDKISLEDQVQSLYTKEQLARLRTTSKVKNTAEVMNQSMEMFQTGQKRRRDSEEAGDSDDGNLYEDQLIQYSQGLGGSPFQSTQSPILLSSDNSQAVAALDSQSPSNSSSDDRSSTALGAQLPSNSSNDSSPSQAVTSSTLDSQSTSNSSSQ